MGIIRKRKGKSNLRIAKVHAIFIKCENTIDLPLEFCKWRLLLELQEM